MRNRTANGIVVLSSLSEWRAYECTESLLLVIFTRTANAHCYDEICALDRLSRRVHFINGCGGMEHLEAQLTHERITQMCVHIRPTWDGYFMAIACLVSSRSTCARRSVGAVLVRDRRILSTGYNGTATGTLNCIDGGCARCGASTLSGSKLDMCVCLHAEESAMMGVPMERMHNCMLYVTLFPCMLCAKKIIQAKIGTVVYGRFYCETDASVKKWLEGMGIVVRRYNRNDNDG